MTGVLPVAMNSFAIIGGGVSGTATFHQLVEKLLKNASSDQDVIHSATISLVW